ncbi:MAG: acyl-protein thioesterase, variant 2 [Marteilia pararefringens]
MNAWYDIYGLGPNYKEDVQGMIRSCESITNIINNIQLKEPDVRHQDIFLGGFSQGGAMSLFYSLVNTNKPLGGVFSHSSYLPGYKDHIVPLNVEKNRETPLMMIHGESDLVVGYQWGVLSHQIAKQYFKNNVLHPIKEMGHTVTPKVMKLLDPPNYCSTIFS